MVATKAAKSLSNSPVTERLEPIAAAQDETGAIIQIGAAVASMIYASFSREIPYLSVTGFMTVPTVRQLK